MKGNAKKLVALILAMSMALSLAMPSTLAAEPVQEEVSAPELISGELLNYAPELAAAAMEAQTDLTADTLENAVLSGMLKGETVIDVSDYNVSAKEAGKAADAALDEVGTDTADAVVTKDSDGKADEVILNLDPRTAAVIAFLNEMPTEASAVAPEDRVQTVEASAEVEEAVVETEAVAEEAVEETVSETEDAEIDPADGEENVPTTDPADGEGSTSTTDPADGEGSTSTTDPADGEGSTSTTDPADGEGSTSTTDPADGEGSTSTADPEPEPQPEPQPDPQPEPQPDPQPQPTDPSDLAGLTIEEKMMLLSAYQDLVDFKDANADLFGIDVPYNTYKDTKDDGKNPFISMMNLCYIYYDETVYTVDGVNYAGFYRLNMLGGSGEGDFVTVTLADGTKQERSYMNAQGLYVMLFAFDLSNRYGAQIFGETIQKKVQACVSQVEAAKKAAGKLSEAEMLLIVNDFICEHAKLNIDYMMASAAGFVAEEEAVNPYLDSVQSDLKNQLQNSGKFTQEQIDEMLPTLCEGIFNMWETNQIGCLGNGRGLCISYVNSTNYLVQTMHPEIYKNADGSWKSYTEVNYKSKTDADGKVTYTESTDAGYIIDTVDTVINAFAKSYGQSQVATSDHYMNAVKVDGKWYYIDSNYVDAYVESMMQNRGEANGSENHLLFMYCEADMKTLFGEEHFVSIDGLYSELAVNDDMEHTWFSYINGAVSVGDDGFYYAYDSTDTFADLNNSGGDMSAIMNLIDMDNMTLSVKDLLAANRTAPSYAIAKRSFGGKDTDATMTKLVDFKTAADGGTTVLQNGKAVVNDELTALYEQFLHEQQKYPSIAISGGLYNGKYYFNLSNCVMSYDIKTGEVARVKEYNTVGAKRDKTIAVGANAFTVTNSNPDLTVENHPIAAMSITDGVMSVAVATNYAMISTPGWRHFADLAQGTNSGAGFGYEFEETNYQADYVDKDNLDLSQLEGFVTVIYMDNDNEEFFYSANFNETTDMSKLTGSHNYQTVTVAPTCGKDGYTEDRCTDCGAIKAGSRVVNEGTALDHHFITSNETYYTNEGYDVIPMDADTSTVDWITGTAYVCAECADSISAEDWAESGYTADQHVYANPTVTWADDYSSATATADACDVCPDAHLDCTLNLKTALSAECEITSTTDAADCTTPADVHYTASYNGKALDTKDVAGVALGHEYEAAKWNWADNKTSAEVELSCIRGDDTLTVPAEVTVTVVPETEHEGETTVYTATASFNDQTFTDEKKDVKLVDLSGETFTAAAEDMTYNRKVQKPVVTVMNGETVLEEGVDYTVTCEKDVKNAGTYELNIVGTGKKFSGVKVVPMTMAKKSIKAENMTISTPADKAYTGKAVTSSVTVKDGETKLSSSSVSVSYKNNTKIGKATVTIKGKGNYTGTVTKTFKINPKAVKLSSLKSSKKAQMTVKWKKGSNITGYQVQYGTKSSFSGAKTATITNAKTLSKTLTKLSKGKKYYVRVRTYKTVSGAKYYSSWSEKKSVTVKK